MELPAPDPSKLLQSWMEWERGEVTPGRVMATLKTGGLRQLLEGLVAQSEKTAPGPRGRRPRRPAGYRADLLVPGRLSSRPRGWQPGRGYRGRRTVCLAHRRLGRSCERSSVGASLLTTCAVRWPRVPGGLQAGSPVAAWKRVTPAELPSGADARPAAVLCLLFEHDGETNVVLTRRAVHLRSHSGEVSFPGGRLQPGERPLQAALREANEEIGIDAGAIEIIGQLTPLTTVRSPALVHCFVGCFRPAAPARLTFSFDPGEVEKVFWVSLAGLAVEGIYHEELWPALEDQGPATCRPTTYRAIPFLASTTMWSGAQRGDCSRN